MKFPTKDSFKEWDHINDAQVEKDLTDTESEIANLKWLRDNKQRIVAAFTDMGFTRSLTSLQLVDLSVEIGERIMLCECLRELQSLRKGAMQ